MAEYPKRLYRNDKGFTVNSLEEEQEFLTQPEPMKEEPIADKKKKKVKE